MARKILIVDDDPDARTFVALALRREGYEAVAATDAISALTVARRERPDVIVLDLRLPAGDGFLVIDLLRKLPELAGTPVILRTGYAEFGTRQRARAFGVAACLQKPVRLTTLFEAIERVLPPIPDAPEPVLAAASF
jgi:CheY-like chemotaxis protein